MKKAAIIETTFREHESKKGDMIFVASHTVDGFKWKIDEYVCLNHAGKALQMAHKWWKDRASGEPPRSVEEAMRRTEEVRPIKSAMIDKDGDFFKIKEVEFGNPGSNVEAVSFDDDSIPF